MYLVEALARVKLIRDEMFSSSMKHSTKVNKLALAKIIYNYCQLAIVKNMGRIGYCKFISGNPKAGLYL